MQISLNQHEVEVAVHQYIEERVTIPEGCRLEVDILGDDTGITAEISFVSNDAPAREPSPVGSRPSAPRKTRRTKAQIEADNKAAEEAAAGKSSETASATPAVTTTAEVAEPSEPVTPEVAKDTNPEAETPWVDPRGDVAEDEPETFVEEVVEPVVEEVKATEPEPEVPAEVVTPKPTQSLFANLRRVKN